MSTTTTEIVDSSEGCDPYEDGWCQGPSDFAPRYIMQAAIAVMTILTVYALRSSKKVVILLCVWLINLFVFWYYENDVFWNGMVATDFFIYWGVGQYFEEEKEDNSLVKAHDSDSEDEEEEKKEEVLKFE